VYWGQVEGVAEIRIWTNERVIMPVKRFAPWAVARGRQEARVEKQTDEEGAEKDCGS
jgi:hypothetical protein